MKEAPTTLKIEHRDENARTGTLQTPHGSVSTPAFMPVATFGAVRGIAAGDLADLGADILLLSLIHI